MKNTILSEEHKNRLRILMLGRKMSNETKEKMSASAILGWEKRKNKNNGQS